MAGRLQAFAGWGRGLPRPAAPVRPKCRWARFGHLLRTPKRALRFILASALAAAQAPASDLLGLAGLDAAPGDESRVIEFIASRVGGTHRRGSNGTLVATFGQGAPHTLLATGVDEPGYAVSAIQPDGYLRLQALADAPFGSELGEHFLGQHVRVSTATGSVLPGVVAAPSVHFRSRPAYRRTEADDLYVDVGSSSASQARAAGLNVLDRVTLEKRVTLMGSEWIAAPWISSRGGAAVLLDVASCLRGANFEGTVTVAFVTQRYPHNAGLVRLLRSLDFDRAVLLRPNGSASAGVASVRGQSDALVREIAALADREGLKIERRPPHGLAFGPFGDQSPWRNQHAYAVMWPPTQNSATPSAAIRRSGLSEMARLLCRLVGGRWEPRREQPPRAPARAASTARRNGSLTQMIEQLVEVPGVSGKEEPVRRLVQSLLPAYARQAMRIDGGGNLIVRLGSGEQPDAAFIAHLDEIGFGVSAISSDGSVALALKGGGDLRLFAWQPMVVHGSRGSVNGVMSGRRSLNLGLSSREAVANAGTSEGDTATVLKRFRRLLGDRVSARSLDDRLGCATLVEAIRRLEGPTRRASGTVDFVFSVGEEIGRLGAMHYAKTASPAHVFPIDTFVTSDSPLESKRMADARLGGGAVLRAFDESGLTPTAEVARVAALARQHKIPLQLGVTAGGNDGSVFRSLDTVNVPIGFPLRYAHSAVETADLRDAEAVVDLIEALALKALGTR
ncbi:MAG: M20/M25/M40 family metallo-hydrolase [Bryobacterales bacterium]|nr:M20/M25/M40 family metallo-hydrolase [Bryobacterales bacterium]MDE0624565.1 M20/M25/M40 family metallo-hydrolase [Bryobacterales bacterium]